MDPLINPLQPLGGTPFVPTPLAPLGMLAGQRCCGAEAPGHPAAGLQSQQMQVLGQLVQVLAMLLTGSPIASPNGSPTGTSAGSPAGGAAADSAPVSGPNQTATDNAAGQPPAGMPKIGQGTRVLEIGDSHTVGAYGQELEKLLEGKGAQVTKAAAVGTSANHWINGGHGAQKLDQLIAKEKPDVVIINLGANSRGSKPGADVRRLAEVAKQGGAQVIWVGPPTTREDMANPAKLKQYDEEMRQALSGLGTYVSSAQFTPRYDGPDGIHYNVGTAKKWAQGVFGHIAG